MVSRLPAANTNNMNKSLQRILMNFNERASYFEQIRKADFEKETNSERKLIYTQLRIISD